MSMAHVGWFRRGTRRVWSRFRRDAATLGVRISRNSLPPVLRPRFYLRSVFFMQGMSLHGHRQGRLLSGRTIDFVYACFFFLPAIMDVFKLFIASVILRPVLDRICVCNPESNSLMSILRCHGTLFQCIHCFFLWNKQHHHHFEKLRWHLSEVLFSRKEFCEKHWGICIVNCHWGLPRPSLFL